MSAEEVAFAEIIGDLVEQWGFKRHLGRIWSLLYLRKDALSPRQIQNELSLSAGNVNLLLGELQTWAVVKRIRVPGDRNFYFEAQTHIWKSIANVLQTRELRILDEAIGGLRKLGQILEKHPKKEIASFQLKRIQHVQSVIETASVLSSLLVNSPPERLNKIGKLIGRLRNM
ncbi:MAG TPA: hypothetical protein VI895_12375 [Bdellovibrionota bacterium]|nr:hypothetical protein [Bdellovibrionota bacterium]